MPAKTERYRFVRWEIEDVNGVARMLPGGFAEVTRGGGLKYERVVFVGPSGKCGPRSTSRGGTSASSSSSASPRGCPTPTARKTARP
jgi:hypothetical protein